LKKTNAELLFMELIHFTRGARRYLHGESPRPEGPAFPCGPDCPPGRPPRRPHCHRSPVFARERILTLLLEHETRQDDTAEAAGPAAQTQIAEKAETAGSGLRQKQLTEEMRINASTMSEFIGHLESDGYVERNIDPSDKRATLITLTEKGRARACELQEKRKEKLDQLFSPLTEEEQKELFRLLNKLQQRGKTDQYDQ
jgi:DNA-binding MarR family transcriptional regulator